MLSQGVSSDTPGWMQLPGTTVLRRPDSPNTIRCKSPQRGLQRCASESAGVFGRPTTPRERRTFHIRDPIQLCLHERVAPPRPRLQETPMLDQTRILLSRQCGRDPHAFDIVHREILAGDGRAFYRMKGSLETYMDQAHGCRDLGPAQLSSTRMAAPSPDAPFHSSLRDGMWTDQVDYTIRSSPGPPAPFRTMRFRAGEDNAATAEIRSFEARHGIVHPDKQRTKKELLALLDGAGVAVPPACKKKRDILALWKAHLADEERRRKEAEEEARRIAAGEDGEDGGAAGAGAAGAGGAASPLPGAVPTSGDEEDDAPDAELAAAAEAAAEAEAAAAPAPEEAAPAASGGGGGGGGAFGFGNVASAAKQVFAEAPKPARFNFKTRALQPGVAVITPRQCAQIKHFFATPGPGQQ